MKSNQLSEFIEIINDAEDMINGGWKTEHSEVRISMPHPSTVTAPAQSAPSQSVAQHSTSQQSMPVTSSFIEAYKELESISAEISACKACGLYAGRNCPVAGAGVIHPAVMFIGEGPGAQEDETGVPFIGKSGQYLDKWLSAIDLERAENCFIGNIIKCRPPGNRDPYPGEIAACKPFLTRQLQIIKPDIIITLGRFASQVICNSEEGLGSLRGRIHSYEGIQVVPTYHPSAVLRNPELRSKVWEDLKKAKDLLNEINKNR